MRHTELKMAPLGSRLTFWDKGSGSGPDFKGSRPTMQGWRSWDREPPDARGINIGSNEAIARWKEDKWSSAIAFYESYNMAHKIGSGTAENHSPSQRVISASEGERLLGFPVG